MAKKRVLLISQPNLLGESLEHTLNNQEDVQVMGALPPDERALVFCAEHSLDMVLMAEDDASSQQINTLTSKLLEAYPDLPIIRVTLSSNMLHIYTSHKIPARTADLIETIRQIPI